MIKKISFFSMILLSIALLFCSCYKTNSPKESQVTQTFEENYTNIESFEKKQLSKMQEWKINNPNKEILDYCLGQNENDDIHLAAIFRDNEAHTDTSIVFFTRNGIGEVDIADGYTHFHIVAEKGINLLSQSTVQVYVYDEEDELYYEYIVECTCPDEKNVNFKVSSAKIN